MSENSVHYPEETHTPPVSDNEDAQSTKSSISISQTKMTCPHCSNDYQIQSMFRHIRSTHLNDFYCYMSVWNTNKLEKMVNGCEPFPIEYTSTNDFDETVEHKLYGCLACNNTFTTMARATTHCKNKKCKSKHLSEFKSIIKLEKTNQKQKKKLPPTRPIPQLKKDIVLEMRRYKYILKCCTEVNSILDKLIQKLPDSELESSKRITNIPTYPQECYSIPTDMDGDKLSSYLRMWGGRVDKIETQFRKTRDYLYFFSYSSVDHMFPESDSRPHGKFIAANYHDTLGLDAYPSIDTPDESLVAPVIPTTQTTTEHI